MKQYLLVAMLGITGLTAKAQQVTGFVNTEAQLKTEKQFQSAIQADGIGGMIKTLSAKQHHLGSPGSKAVAQQVLSWMKSWGLDAKIETYKVLFPTPKTRVLEMGAYKATLKEVALKADPSTGQADELATYNAWSADGDVTAPLVFVNYGIPADYEMLDRMGISVKGKIVIAKYGRSWRGIKPKVAQEHGAIGCIIYSDPQEDGYRKGDVYPQGAFKHETGVQRGSVMDMPIYPGDPLTPNVGATANASRLDRLSAPNLLKIPVLPISYKDAQPLLAALGGPVAPADWQGALPITYHVGPGVQNVHLKMEFNWDLVDCHNVIGSLKGSDYPNEWVIRGNHHDAWTYGASDPISGLASMLEEARVLGEMYKAGWKPKRTMVFCAWDGEEPGLLGSTEWVEDHAAELQQKCVAYINSDGNGRGYLEAGGSHALEILMDEISKTVTDPQTGINIYERRKAGEFVNAGSLAAKKSITGSQSLALGALGSGSDYSAFLQHLGISALNLGFGGEDDGGEYHTNFDSYAHYSNFKDPGFAYCAALSKVAGLAAIRLASADFLPYDFSRLYKTIDGYQKDLQSFTDNMRETTILENTALKDKYYLLARNPVNPLLPPAAKKEVPFLDFSPLQNAMTQLEKTTTDLQATAGKLKDNPAIWAKWNTTMYQAEQQLLSEKGLPRRAWYRHTIYAPGFYTGYGVKTLPGVREAIEQREFAEAQEQIKVLAASIEKLSRHLATLL